MQQTADMIGMITNAKGALDVFGHERTGPLIGGESGGSRAFEQLFF